MVLAFLMSGFVLDVKTPSDTLEVKVTFENKQIGGSLTSSVEATGSVATAGRQVFRFTNPTEFTFRDFGGFALDFQIHITGTGSGFVELGTTASADEDDGHIYRFGLADTLFRSTNGGSTYQQQASAHLPRIGVVGHSKYVLKLESAGITSSPYNGEAYAVGETIEVGVRLNSPIRVVDDALSVPLLLGTNPGQRRNARLIAVDFNYFEGGYFLRQLIGSLLQFSYTVQPDDVDTDGVVLASDPLGAEADGKIESALHSGVRMDLSFPAVVID